MNEQTPPPQDDVVQEEIEETIEPPVSETNIDYKEKWLRAQADYQNLQKEISAQRGMWVKMSELQILEEFIPVYDNFKKAFAYTAGSEDKEWQNWQKGIEYIKKQFSDILTQHGVSEIETVGKPFDPTRHEALSEEVSENHEEGIIIRELAGGYMMADKVIQVAKVVVCKK